ncbi:unnamed protein product [Pleuronectes platessa]|uniref:Uncharacterized protein n=1 Tax=Pleuronectes platessa TaxID=8262 RepID=A0A9N7TTP8_PLEPL|nr:unnamed protein product [Pleuronectes platessa]
MFEEQQEEQGRSLAAASDSPWVRVHSVLYLLKTSSLSRQTIMHHCPLIQNLFLPSPVPHVAHLMVVCGSCVVGSYLQWTRHTCSRFISSSPPLKPGRLSHFDARLFRLLRSCPLAVKEISSLPTPLLRSNQLDSLPRHGNFPVNQNKL